MKTYCIIRYELIESFGHCDAEDEAGARKQWEDGKVDLGLADDTTERGPIKVFEVVNNEAGPDPDPLGSMTKLQERVRILREALSELLDPPQGTDIRDRITKGRFAMEVTKEGA